MASNLTGQVRNIADVATAIANGDLSRKITVDVKGEILELKNTLMGSIAVVVAAIIIAMAGFTAADSIASALIGLMILPRTWSLLREAVDVLMEATPKGIKLDVVRQHLLAADGVGDVHDLHAWTITSGLPVVSAHIVLRAGADPASVLDELCRCLSGDFDVEHSTFQLETHDRRRVEEASHS